jgi:hypothetical protein
LPSRSLSSRRSSAKEDGEGGAETNFPLILLCVERSSFAPPSGATARQVSALPRCSFSEGGSSRRRRVRCLLLAFNSLNPQRAIDPRFGERRACPETSRSWASSGPPMNSPRALSARRRLISATDKHRFTQKEYFRRLARTKLLLGLLINLGPPKLNLNASSSESVSIRVNLWLGLLPLTGKRLKFIGSEVEWVPPSPKASAYASPARRAGAGRQSPLPARKGARGMSHCPS